MYKYLFLQIGGINVAALYVQNVAILCERISVICLNRIRNKIVS